MVSAWGKSWGVAWGASWGSVASTLGGAGTAKVKQSLGEKYDYSHWMRHRPEKIIVNDHEYEPEDTVLTSIIESAALEQEPFIDDEMGRQDRKLSRNFLVRTQEQDVVVPIFRPMLKHMPSFKSALAKDFASYANKVQLAVEEERKRIFLLLFACSDL